VIRQDSDDGWDIEILDPIGDVIVCLHCDGWHTIEEAFEVLHRDADLLLSHLNRS
jgi:hypothetical protein